MTVSDRWQVLVVERSPEESLLLQHILESLGSRQFMVTVALSVAEARTVLDRQHFDVVTVAIELLDPADPEGIRRLRRAGSSRALVAVTHADAPQEVLDQALEAGADAVVRKDDRNPMEVLQVLRQLLANRP